MKLKLLAFAAALILPAFLFTEKAGAVKSDSCAHCHGTDGNSTSSAYPSLAGQTRDYLYRQIKTFKEGQRKNSMMSPAAVVLSDQAMQDLAEYFSGQTLVRSAAKTDPAVVGAGKENRIRGPVRRLPSAEFQGPERIPARFAAKVSVHRQAAQGFSRWRPRQRRPGSHGQEPDR
jgi:cytochrome c553